MNIIDIIKKGIWQCEERHKFRLEQEKKTPVEKFSNIHKFSLLISSLLKKINYDLFLFVPTAKDTPCYITEEGGKNLKLKEIYDFETCEVLRENLKEFSKYYDDLSNENEKNFLFFEYNSYAINKNKPTEIIWRILNNTISTRIQKVNIIVIEFSLPEFLKPISYKLEEIPEGYLFIFLSGENINKIALKDIGFAIKNAYINFIWEYKEIGEPILKEIMHYDIETKRRSFGEIPGNLDNRVFIGGNYDNMAILNYIIDLVSEFGFVPICARDFDAPKDDISDFDLRLVSSCKYAIFEVTTPQGDLMEIVRALDYKNNTLLLYQVRESKNRDMPRNITSMLSTIKSEKLEKLGYYNIKELPEIIGNWLNGLTNKNT